MANQADRKKRRERMFVEKTAELLCKKWTIGPDQEHPDFLIEEEGREFGIEVCEIFVGDTGRKGSLSKIKETTTQRAVDGLRRAYEIEFKVPIIVKFLGDLCLENQKSILSKLIALNLGEKPVTFQTVIEVDDGPARLRAFVTRSLRPDWYHVDKYVGWVARNPWSHIALEIEKKAAKLSTYQSASSDVRLLVVADRKLASGKFVLEDQRHIQLNGFSSIYFLSYPEMVTEFIDDSVQTYPASAI